MRIDIWDLMSRKLILYYKSMISIPLYIFLLIYAAFLLVFIFFFFANFFHLFHMGGTTVTSFLVTIILVALTVAVLLLTTYSLRTVSWSDTLNLGGDAYNIFNPIF